MTIPADRIIPTIQILLAFGSCLVYLYNRNYPQAVYWFSGALITYSVTWMMK